MSFFPDFSTFLEIRTFSIKWYAILIVSGAFLSYAIIRKNAVKAGYKIETIDDLFLMTFFMGVIGSRIWYVIFYDLKYYLANPLKILMTWEGGLAIQGGLLFGAAYVYFATRKMRISYFRLGDIILPNVLLAQAIGRWGNFFNQEAFGITVSESFYKYWPNFIKSHMFIDGAYRLPTFFIESIFNFIGWFLIVMLLRKHSEHKRGNQIYAYLMWYGVTRFYVEGFRTDSLYFFNFRIAQIVSIVFLIIGLLGTFGVFRRMVKIKPTVLFDFDGTLADTEPMITETFKVLYEKYYPKQELPDGMSDFVLGPPLELSIEKYFPDQDLKVVLNEYRELNEALHHKEFNEIVGATELLKYLKENNYPVGIVSNKVNNMIQLGLDLLNQTQYVDVVIGSDDIESGLVKPHPDGIILACERLGSNVDSLIYVGDSVGDILAGKNAHAFTIGYNNDVTRLKALENVQANRVIANLIEIKDILKEDIIWTNDMA